MLNIVALVHPDSAAYRGRPLVPHTIGELYRPLRKGKYELKFFDLIAQIQIIWLDCRTILF